MHHIGVLLIAERMKEGSGSNAAQRRSYPCPFPQCKGRMYDRLADHISAKHKLKGDVNKELRHKVLDIAHKHL